MQYATKLSSTELLLLNYNLKVQKSWEDITLKSQQECDNCKPVITSAGVFWFTCLHPQIGSVSIQIQTFPTTHLAQYIHWWPLWLPVSIQQITKLYRSIYLPWSVHLYKLPLVTTCSNICGLDTKVLLFVVGKVTIVIKKWFYLYASQLAT